MKFLKVTFRCFGPFEEQTLDLSKCGGLNIVFGQNEAGKSTALRGLHAFLFGWGKTTADDFRFKTTQFRVQAAVQNAQGELLECVRRKGNIGTLRSPDEKQEVAESLLSQYLGGLQQLQFEQLFGLDGPRLVEGGRQIAEGKGDLGEALFAAGAGLAGLRKLSESLAARQDALYKPAGRNQPIAKALREYREQVNAIREHVLPPEKYATAVQHAHVTEDVSQRLREERDQKRLLLSLCENYRSALPTIELRQRALARLELVAKAPLLAGDFEPQLNNARKDRAIAAATLERQQAARTELLQQQQAPLPAALLAEEAEIDELKKLIGADVKARADALKADTRRREVEGEARDIFRELTGTIAWSEMDQLDPRLEDKQRINDLVADSKAVSQAVTLAEERVRTAREQLAVAEAKLQQLPVVPATDAGSAVINYVAGHGPLEEQLQELRTKLAADEIRLQNDFSRLQPAATGDWQSAAQVRVPTAEAITEFRQRFCSVQQILARITQDQTQLARELAASRSELAAVAGADPLPTVHDLETARSVRDRGLLLIRERLDQRVNSDSEASFTQQHAPGRSLIDATEATVRQTDYVADRLRHEAEHVAQWQALQQAQAALQIRQQELQVEKQTTETRLEPIEQEWQLLWQPSGIAPQSPDVMLPWLTRWLRLAEQAADWQAAQRTLATKQQQIDDLQAQVRMAFPSAEGSKSLVEALQRAQQAARRAADQLVTANRLQEETRRLHSELTAAENDLERARQRQEKWNSDWSTVISVLRLKDGNVSVSTAQIYLKRIDDMQAHLKEARIKAATLRDFKRDQETLLARVNALRQRLQPEAKPSTEASLDEDFRQLELDLKNARVCRTQRQELDKLLKKMDLEINAATLAVQEADATLSALAAQVGVTAPDAISAAVQQAKERAAAERDIKEYDAVLARNSRGRNLEDFISAALAARENVDTQQGDLESRLKTLDGAIKAAEAEALQAGQVLAGFQRASDAAAEAKQNSESIAAGLEENVLEYAAIHLASVALERAKERYRARNQESMLHRAGEFFRTLTNQKFHGLDIDNEEGDDVLKAIRPAGHVHPRVPVSGLSEGTRDQLFLALRLAGIEQHLQNREPVPLIIDDVLMTFDDERCSATLRCLAELAQKTQVLLFTHHQHVVDLAQKVHPSTQVHRL